MCGDDFGGPIASLTPMNLNCFGLIGTSHFGTVNFNSDGSVTKSVSAPDGSSMLTKWFDPVTAAIGSSYWIKFVVSSGSGWTSGPTANTVVSLSAGQSVSWTASSGSLKIASIAVTIYSDSGGTNQVASGNLLVDIESNN